MTTAAIVGLGKLGTPIAVSMGLTHSVLGYDLDPKKMRKRPYEHRETGPDGVSDFQYYFDKADLTFRPLQECIEKADLVFVVVQTPHEPEFEGVTRLTNRRADFDYGFLIEACKQVGKFRRPSQPVAVVSTVLPGTTRRDLLPLLPGVVYNPAFPAMGTVMRDFLDPEFVLLGGEDSAALRAFEDFYRSLDVRAPVRKVSIESAEFSKVAYNCYVGLKLIYTNTLGEMAHRIPYCDVDEVTDTLKLATKRLISPAYLSAGVGDGGPCHNRDNIAMSWLAEEMNLSGNLFDTVMYTREWQAEWLVNLFLSYGNGLPKVILGKSYKPESAITTGSAAVLMANLMRERNVEFLHYDPFVDEVSWTAEKEPHPPGPSAFLIATKHSVFVRWAFPAGSVVVDPHRYVPPQKGVKVIPVGVGR